MKSFVVLLFFVFIGVLQSKKIDTSCDFDIYDLSSLNKKDSFVFTSHKNFGRRPYGKAENCRAKFKVNGIQNFSIKSSSNIYAAFT